MSDYKIVELPVRKTRGSWDELRTILATLPPEKWIEIPPSPTLHVIAQRASLMSSLRNLRVTTSIREGKLYVARKQDDSA